MENEPEVIRQQMQDNRSALTEKLETLEERVMGVATAVSETVEGVKDGVSGTVESVKDTVQDTVDAVKESVQATVATVRDAFDVRKQVEAHPLAMVGGSIGVGFLIGMLMPRILPRRESASRAEASKSSWEAPPARTESRPASFLGSRLLEPLENGLSRLKNLALSSIAGLVKDTVVKAVPAELGEKVQTIFNDVVSQIQGSAPEKDGSEQQSSGGEHHEAAIGHESKMGRAMGSASW